MPLAWLKAPSGEKFKPLAEISMQKTAVCWPPAFPNMNCAWILKLRPSPMSTTMTMLTFWPTIWL